MGSGARFGPVVRAVAEIERRSRRRWVAWGAGILVVGGVVGWAAATVLSPAQDVTQSTAFTYVEVVRGEVGASITLNTTAEWTLIPVGSNLTRGVVTSVNLEPGQEVRAGDVLYTVNLRPVVVAQGSVPAFQALSLGTSGADVAQLQSLLETLGFYDYEVDGTFDYVTMRAVRAWQKSLGVDADGVVQAGDIVFVPSLPTRLALDPETVRRGASLEGGEEVVRGLPPAPVFTIPVTESQAALMPAGTRVEMTGPSGQPWDGVVIDQEVDEHEGVTVLLGGTEGASICREECGSLPATGQILLRSRIVTVEPVVGLSVPSAAMLSRADGSLSVIDDEGVEHEVTVVTSARGMSIIDGVEAGLMVRVPAMEG